jgi:hypothetical protein
MNSEQRRLKQMVEKSINEFNANEMYLLENNLSERCICSRFAIYLQNEVALSNIYQDYIVDVEYNRGAKGKDYEPKRLSNHSKPITVDLIVHKRGYRDQVRQHGEREIIGFCNLICIEMKKPHNTKRTRLAIEADNDRLTIMTRNNEGFGYSIGFMIYVNSDSLSINQVFYDVYN